jgi:hypothetical protein
VELDVNKGGAMLRLFATSALTKWQLASTIYVLTTHSNNDMTASKGDQITSLRKRVSKIDVEIEEIKAEQRRQSTQINQLMAERQRLNDMIESMIPKKLNVTDHALLRYIERVMGIDIEDIRNKIVNTQVETMVATLGDSNVPLGGGVYAVVRNQQVVTIGTADMIIKKPGAGKRVPRGRDRHTGDDDLLQEAEE